MNNATSDWFTQTSDLLADLPADLYAVANEFDTGDINYANTTEIKDLNEYPLSDLEELLSSPNIRLGPDITSSKPGTSNVQSGNPETTEENQQLNQTIANNTVSSNLLDATTTIKPDLNDIENSLWDGLISNPMQGLTQTKDNILSINARMLKRQWELNRALKKQEELNQRLEEQLKQAQLHQKVLEQKIRAQHQSPHEKPYRQGTTRAMLGDITASSRLNASANSTPVKPVKQILQRVVRVSRDEQQSENLSKKYQRLQFSAQPTLVSRGATVDGSPQRRVYTSRGTLSNDGTRGYRVRPTNSISSLDLEYTEADKNVSVTDNDVCLQPSAGTSCTVPTTAISSPVFSPNNTDLGMENTVSPVLTNVTKISRRSSLIPSSSVGYSRNNTANGRSNHHHYHSLSLSSPKNQLHFLATRTPVKKLTSNQSRRDYNLFDPLSTTTPKLAPPRQVMPSSPLEATSQSTSVNPILFEKSKVNERQPVVEADIKAEIEPESHFTVSKTPSPILKSQGHFQGQSPQFSQLAQQIENNNINPLESPLKITRKLTTLPRGSIDIYVKELPDKMFECLYPGCGKTFKRRYNIRSHIQTHLEDRPYACDFEGCDKAFVRNHDLVRHKKSHFEKMYACPCGKKFNREDALVVHRSRMICIGGKRYENVVIKRSPRKRGRPRKNEVVTGESSPTKKVNTGDRKTKVEVDPNIIAQVEQFLNPELPDDGLKE